MRVELKFTMTVFGVRCVMTTGVQMMRKLYVETLDSPMMKRKPVQMLSLVKDPDPYGYVMLIVKDRRIA